MKIAEYRNESDLMRAGRLAGIQNHQEINPNHIQIIRNIDPLVGHGVEVSRSVEVGDGHEYMHICGDIKVICIFSCPYAPLISRARDFIFRVSNFRFIRVRKSSFHVHRHNWGRLKLL